jgi:hypothetical protein
LTNWGTLRLNMEIGGAARVLFDRREDIWLPFIGRMSGAHRPAVTITKSNTVVSPYRHVSISLLKIKIFLLRSEPRSFISGLKAEVFKLVLG